MVHDNISAVTVQNGVIELISFNLSGARITPARGDRVLKGIDSRPDGLTASERPLRDYSNTGNLRLHGTQHLYQAGYK